MSWVFRASTGEAIPIYTDSENRYCGVVDDKIEQVMLLGDDDKEMLKLGRFIGLMVKSS